MEDCELPRDYPWTRVLDEIAQAGFTGTELGPYGFYPSGPQRLRAELAKRGLEMCSAFIAVPLADRAAVKRVLATVRQTAELISAAGATMLILCDEIGGARLAVAGRRDEANRLAWNDDEWKRAAEAVHAVAGLVRQFGLGIAFHHHVGTHVETPEEIDRLLAEIPASVLNLCLDTGHYAYGGGDPAVFAEVHAKRIAWLHLKDVNAARLGEARVRKLDFHAGVRHGIFAPLGQGAVDFRRVFAVLKDYRGWAVVEQDVLPGGTGADAPLPNARAAREYLHGFGL